MLYMEGEGYGQTIMNANVSNNIYFQSLQWFWNILYTCETSPSDM